MKRYLLLGLLTGAAMAQGNRVDNRVTNVQAVVPFGAQAPLMAVPNATVTICAYPAISSPCTNKVLIYSDAALTQPAANPLQADGQGRYGFWIAAGTYTYSVQTVGGVTLGTFPFTSSGGGSGSIVSVNGKVGVVSLTASDVGADAVGAASNAVGALPTVARTGNYADLSGKPTIPSVVATTNDVTIPAGGGSATVNKVGGANASDVASSTAKAAVLNNSGNGLSVLSNAGTYVAGVIPDPSKNGAVLFKQSNTGSDTGLLTPTAGQDGLEFVAGHLNLVKGASSPSQICTADGTNCPAGSGGATTPATSSLLQGAGTANTTRAADYTTPATLGTIDSRPAAPTVVLPNSGGGELTGDYGEMPPVVSAPNTPYATLYGLIRTCRNTADGFNNGNNGGYGNAAYGWYLVNCIAAKVTHYAVGIGVSISLRAMKFAIGDFIGVANYMYAHGGCRQPDDECTVGIENQIYQNAVTRGTITSGGTTGSNLLQSTITSGPSTPSGEAGAYDAGERLIDISKLITTTTLTTYGFDTTLNSPYYNISTTPTQSEAWGNIVGSSATPNKQYGPGFISTTVTIALGAGSPAFVSSTASAHHVFASGPFQQEMQLTAGAVSGSNQTVTILTNHAWNGTNNSVIMQGGLAGASMIDSSINVSTATNIPSYPIVGAIGTKLYFANCNNRGQCNSFNANNPGTNGNPGNVLPNGKSVSIYPSAGILSTGGVSGQAILDYNTAPWAPGDVVISPSTTQFGVTGMRIVVGANSPDSCGDVALGCGNLFALDTSPGGVTPLASHLQGRNNGGSTGVSDLTYINLAGLFKNNLVSTAAPTDAAFRYYCTQANGTPASQMPFLGITALGSGQGGYGLLKVLCSSLELNWTNRISANSLYSFNDVTGATGVFSGAVTAASVTATGVVTGSSVTSTGTAPAIVCAATGNTDCTGELTMTGGTATRNWTGTYTVRPICTSSDETAIATPRVVTTTTSLTISGTSGDTASYICIVRN